MNRNRTFYLRPWVILFLLGGLCSILPVPAATVWNGPTISFFNNGGDPTLPANQDSLTPSVALTRGGSRGIYNAVLENGYIHNVSPLETEWAYGSLANYLNLNYKDWEHWNGMNPPSMVGQPAVLHVIPEDVYLSITFTSWPQRSGGFSYDRSTPSIPEPSSAALGAITLAVIVARKIRKCQQEAASSDKRK